MTTKVKPKKLSKTKAELRRLREFAKMFIAEDRSGLNWMDGAILVSPSFNILRDHAALALTGKKSTALANHDAVAADVKRLNAMGPKGLEKFLAGK